MSSKCKFGLTSSWGNCASCCFDEESNFIVVDERCSGGRDGVEARIISFDSPLPPATSSKECGVSSNNEGRTIIFYD